MKLNFNENACKCLALIVLSAIVGVIVYRQKYFGPMRSIEHYGGAPVSGESPYLIFMYKYQTNFYKVALTPSGYKSKIILKGSTKSETESTIQIKWTSTPPGSAVGNLGDLKSYPNSWKSGTKIIPTDNNNVKYINNGETTWCKMTIASRVHPEITYTTDGVPGIHIKINDKISITSGHPYHTYEIKKSGDNGDRQIQMTLYTNSGWTTTAAATTIATISGVPRNMSSNDFLHINKEGGNDMRFICVFRNAGHEAVGYVDYLRVQGVTREEKLKYKAILPNVMNQFKEIFGKQKIHDLYVSPPVHHSLDCHLRGITGPS